MFLLYVSTFHFPNLCGKMEARPVRPPQTEAQIRTEKGILTLMPNFKKDPSSTTEHL